MPARHGLKPTGLISLLSMDPWDHLVPFSFLIVVAVFVPGDRPWQRLSLAPAIAHTC